MQQQGVGCPGCQIIKPGTACPWCGFVVPTREQIISAIAHLVRDFD